MDTSSLQVVVITMSDRASESVYEDVSGAEVEKRLTLFFAENGTAHSIRRVILPDDAATLTSVFRDALREGAGIIITTGGTGIGPRDITPDTIRPLLTKEIPGIMEVIRVRYGLQFAGAALSRSIAGVSGKTLVYCLPGSPKAVNEYLDEILKTMMHVYHTLQGERVH